MERKVSEPKWEAKFSATLQHANADKIWSFFQDFFGLHRWFPTLSTCYGIHGKNGEVGSVRYCAGFSIPAIEGNGEMLPLTSWSKERLIAIDKVEKWLSYEVVDSNLGFQGYVSTVKVIPSGDGGGRFIEWFVSVEPVRGWTFDDLLSKFEAGLRLMAEKMEDDSKYVE